MYQVREQVKQKILHNFIEKSYEYDIESLINGRRRWKKTGRLFETMSKIFLALGGIISFSSGYFEIGLLSFLSGTVSVISLSFLQFSSFCYLENKKQSNELNITLKKLGLDTVPELSRDIDNNILIRNSPMNYEQMNNILKYKANPVIYIPDENNNNLTDNNTNDNNNNNTKNTFSIPISIDPDTDKNYNSNEQIYIDDNNKIQERNEFNDITKIKE